MVNYTWYIIGGVVIALILLILILRRIRKKKIKAMEIPADILEDFNEVERRLRESHGDKDPQRILWELSREKSGQARGENYTRTSNGDIRRVPETRENQLGTESQRRESIQTGTTPSINQPNRSSQSAPKQDIRSFLAKLGRK